MALLLIDVINPLDFPGGAALLARALPAGARIVASKRRAREAAIPTVYVNVNLDAWHLGFRELVADVRASSPSARQLIDPLEPDPARDHFVLKPRHSGFFRTGLQALLERLGRGRSR